MDLEVVTTVVTPAANYNLTTLLAVLGDLNINNADEQTNFYLKRLITQCSAIVSQYCNRVFASETVLDTIYPTRDDYPYQVPGGVGVLQLSRWPVSAIASVTEGTKALVQDTDFKAALDAGQLIRLCQGAVVPFSVRWGACPVAVQYTAGYASVPPDLESAVIQMIKAKYFARGRDPYIKSEEVTGVQSYQYWVQAGSGGGMPPDISDVLDNYRQPVIA